MATNIEWTEKTWNPLVGCTKVSAGCKNCYAETMGKRLRAMALADIAAGKDPGRKRPYIDAVDERGRWTGRVVTLPEALGEPLKWRKPVRVFVNSMSDLFHPTVPFEFIAAAFAVMGLSPRHTYQALTKQPGRAVEFFAWLGDNPGRVLSDAADRHFGDTAWAWLGNFIDGWSAPKEIDDGNPADGTVRRWPLPNVWLGTSVEDQPTADERIQHLAKCPAAVRFVSYEPALGGVDFSRWLNTPAPEALDGDPHARFLMTELLREGRGDCRRALDWIIVGGESGPGARPFDVAWARSTVEQCREAGVACFVKQLGSWPVATRAGTDLHGIREFHSFDHWVAKAQTWLGRGCACFDAKGRRCAIGGDFMRARDEGAFPVAIYEPFDLRDKKGGDPAEWPEMLRVREWPTVTP